MCSTGIGTKISYVMCATCTELYNHSSWNHCLVNNRTWRRVLKKKFSNILEGETFKSEVTNCDYHATKKWSSSGTILSWIPALSADPSGVTWASPGSNTWPGNRGRPLWLSRPHRGKRNGTNATGEDHGTMYFTYIVDHGLLSEDQNVTIAWGQRATGY
jgi:hypothetical protein